MAAEHAETALAVPVVSPAHEDATRMRSLRVDAKAHAAAHTPQQQRPPPPSPDARRTQAEAAGARRRAIVLMAATVGVFVVLAVASGAVGAGAGVGPAALLQQGQQQLQQQQQQGLGRAPVSRRSHMRPWEVPAAAAAAATRAGARRRCRGTVQGRDLVADSSGAVCARASANEDGCCQPGEADARFSCDECRADIGCCAVYEHCVSCCVGHFREGDAAGSAAAGSGPAGALQRRLPVESAAVAPGAFDRCAHACRTSSQSNRHGNQFLASRFRHCHAGLTGEAPRPPDLAGAVEAAADEGASCSDTCDAAGLACHPSFLAWANRCDRAAAVLGCDETAGCRTAGAGSDLAAAAVLPALVDGKCVMMPGRGAAAAAAAAAAAERYECGAADPRARRLCVCVPRSDREAAPFK